ncbi:MAG TPA: ATP-binding protein [Blastocatellia bacterium]|nr:ATP-binding protein [Blastocatellia bacterium]
MALELTFKQACDLIKTDEPKLITAVDNLLGLTLICSPIILGPAALPLLSLLSVKNELTRLGKGIFETFTKKRDDDFVERQAHMQAAYALICYTAFFEALDRSLPEEFRKRINLLTEEKGLIVKDAHAKIKEIHPEPADKCLEIADVDRFSIVAITFPHPTESWDQQQARVGELYKQMAAGFKEFTHKLALWKDTDEKERDLVLKTIEQLPQLAIECFEAQYFELSRRYEDFAVWANLHEHKKTKELIGSLSRYVQQYAALAKADKVALDIGFAKLHQAALSIPQTLKVAQATEIVEGLGLHYNARINEAIIEEKEESQEDVIRLAFPKIRDAFIPQSFRVLRQLTSARRLEDEETWKDLARRDDLGAFLLNYLSSPYSTETPLVVLGHPGSGKSLLTTILSAQLMSEHFTAIRVPLREVNSDAGIVAQIEEQIARITNIKLDSWAKVSSAFKNNPPVVILDGYDELLQASGKVFSGYLKDVQNFQKNEAEQGRPVRVMVTSRITLIDKATIPKGSTIVRLLEFDKRQRERWISIWNKTNVNYFKQANVQPFELPDEDDKDATKILSLAEQPLLLLMLALYDSEDNKLKNSKSLDRTALYESLLNRFVVRERSKERKFDDLNKSEKKKEIDRDMQRLGVAAIGMYNRRKLHILSPELNEDLRFFNLERQIEVTNGRPMTQADLLLGSFFFVHKSKSQQKAGAADLHEETAAFEFLHNTFGEFLTADFIIRQAMTEVGTLKALEEQEALRGELEQKLGKVDAFSPAWFASLVYTPLFTRPVVLEMIREWIEYMLKRKQLSRQVFLSYLDKIILNQIRRLLTKSEMPSIMRKEAAQEGYRAPFGEHPLIGHIAIYSINLILLRAIVTKDSFIFDESEIASHEDGSRPWDQLTHIWRSWFSIDNLNGITAILRADRNESQITIQSKETLRVSESRNRLETFLNINISLADNVSSGLVGLLLYDPAKENHLELEDISHRLSAENIDLEFQMMMNRLFRTEIIVHENNLREFLRLAEVTLAMALELDKTQELEHIILRLRRGLKRVLGVTLPRVQSVYEDIDELFHPRLLQHLLYQNPTAALDCFRLMREIGADRNLRRYGDEIIERTFHPKYLDKMLYRNPQDLSIFLQLIREFRSELWSARYGEKIFERLFRPMHFRELIPHQPETALSFIQLAREMGAERWIERYKDELFEQLLLPLELEELIRHRPETALSFIQLAREVGAERWMERYKDELFERLLHPRRLKELVYHNPESALSLLQLAREMGEEQWTKYLRKGLFEEIFHPGFLRWLFLHKPLTFVETLRLIRASELHSSADVLREVLVSHLQYPDKDKSLLKQLPLESLPDLQWLAQITADEELSSILAGLVP